jgi:SAM-dependent methyltransferase
MESNKGKNKKEVVFGDDKLKGVSIEVQTYKNEEFDINLPKNKDLVPGQYEGGIKLWECSLDLCNFLPGYVGWYPLESVSILELGCGHGLPGLYFLLRGSHVMFQDFNEEVLTKITTGYIEQLNDKYKLSLDKYALLSGDWKDFASKVENCQYGKGCEKLEKANFDKFDIIISADTIYNIQNYDSLYNIIKTRLKNPGICFIASKKFYYGVGGGTNQFIDYVNQQGDFNVTVAKEINDGISNIRQILELRHK